MTTIDLIDWTKCLCRPEDYPEDSQTNPRCPEHGEGLSDG
jgi:hypothetical protein